MYNCYLHQPDIHKYNLIYCNAHTLLRYIRVITTYPQQQTLAVNVVDSDDIAPASNAQYDDLSESSGDEDGSDGTDTSGEDGDREMRVPNIRNIASELG